MRDRRGSGGTKFERLFPFPPKENAWLFPVALQHRGGNLSAGRPLAPPLPGVGFILLSPARIRLYLMTFFQKPRLISRHTRHKSFGLGEDFPQTYHGRGRINRRIDGDKPKIRFRIARGAAISLITPSGVKPTALPTEAQT